MAYFSVFTYKQKLLHPYNSVFLSLLCVRERNAVDCQLFQIQAVHLHRSKTSRYRTITQCANPIVTPIPYSSIIAQRNSVSFARRNINNIVSSVPAQVYDDPSLYHRPIDQNSSSPKPRQCHHCVTQLCEFLPLQ